LKNNLFMGKAEVDITPEIGTFLAGYLEPRKSKKVKYPLKIKAIVLDNGNTTIVYMVMDLIALPASIGNHGIKLASKQTGIPVENIMWATSHTHSGPYTMPIFEADPINKKWLESFPGKISQCIKDANDKKSLVRIKAARVFYNGLAINRRIRFKDGREVNAWLLDNIENNMQSVGSAGVIDSEMIALAFEGIERNNLYAVLFQSVIHPNSDRNHETISGDYPSVVASKISEKYGDKAATIFVPGACGDINPVWDPEFTGNEISKLIIGKLESNESYEEEVILKSIKKEVTIPLVDCNLDFEDKFNKSQYKDSDLKVFYNALKAARQKKKKEINTVIQAWRIGRYGFVSMPGEIFSEIGIKIKKYSPFKWTIPVGLGGDYIGYLVPEQAWEAGGYESLIGAVQQPSSEGVKILLESSIEALKEIY